MVMGINIVVESLGRRAKKIQAIPAEERRKIAIDKAKSSTSEVVAFYVFSKFKKVKEYKTASTGAVYYTEDYLDYNAFLKVLLRLLYDFGTEDSWRPEGNLVFRVDDTISQASIKDTETRASVINMSNLQPYILNAMKDQRVESARFFGRMCEALLERRLPEDIVAKIREKLWEDGQCESLFESKAMSKLGLNKRAKKTFSEAEPDMVENTMNVELDIEEFKKEFYDMFAGSEYFYEVEIGHEITIGADHHTFIFCRPSLDLLPHLSEVICRIWHEQKKFRVLFEFAPPKRSGIKGEEFAFGTTPRDKDSVYFMDNKEMADLTSSNIAKAFEYVMSSIERILPIENELAKKEMLEESFNLGLNKKAKKAFNDTDAIDNISQISFEDKEVERICHEHGVYTYDDAREVTSIKEWFSDNTDIKSFNELRFFTGLKEIADWAFSCSTLQSITIPDSVTSIGSHAFTWCMSLESINFPDSVSSIGTNAFDYCMLLQSITIPDRVTSIGEWTFSRCKSLKSVTIPNSVTIIEDDAFYECKSLQSISIPNRVTSIGSHAFSLCDTLQSIIIPDSVTSIGDYAFSRCKSLQSITIPDSVTSIGKEIFKGHDHLTIYISKSSPVYNIIVKAYPDLELVDPSEMNEAYNLGLNKRAKKQHEDTDVIDNISQIQFEDPEVERICHEHGVYTIGDAREVTSIEGWFMNNKSIETFNEFKFFTGLNKIEDYAFSWCKSLKTISIPDSVTSIGRCAFNVCRSLVLDTLPDSVTSIGAWAFYYCETLQSFNIPDSVTSIAEYAFSRCFSLQSITIPDSVKRIGAMLFYECTALKTICISKDCPVYEDIKESYSAINLVDPSKMNEAHALGLNKCAKKQHEETDTIDNIASIPFEDKEVERICHEHSVYTYDDAREVTSIKGWFSDNADIKSFNELKLFTGLKEIEECAFSWCRSLKSVIIPDSVTSIGFCAFNWCVSLKAIRIPDSVTSIGEWAFSRCKSLQSINIPDRVTSIGKETFRGYDHLTIYISKSSPVYSVIEKAYSDSDIKLKAYISLVDPSEMNEAHALGLNKRARDQFSSEDAVDNLETPMPREEFINLAVEEFSRVRGVVLVDKASRLQSDYFIKNDIRDLLIYLKSNLEFKHRTSTNNGRNLGLSSPIRLRIMKKDGEDRFAVYTNRYYGLASIDSLGSFKTDLVMFGGEDIPWKPSLPDDDSRWFPLAAKSLRESVKWLDNYLKSMYEPEEFFLEESSISLGLNKRAKKQHEETDTIENISQISFEDQEIARICHEHGVYTFGDAASVTSLEGWFIDNEDIKSFNEFKHFTGLKKIEGWAFYNCNALKEINIPNSVTSIGSHAFAYCNSLQEVTIPEGVYEMDEYAFADCFNLRSISLPESLKFIGEYSFSFCERLRSIVIPSQVKTIESATFIGCHDLQTVTITSDLAYIGEHAFHECASLQDIIIPDSVHIIGIDAFKECKTLRSINIPDGVTNIGIGAFKGCQEAIVTISKKTPAYGTMVSFKDKNEIKGICLASDMNESHELGLNKRAKKKHESNDGLDVFGEYVDLGLPSGTLWAAKNLEAEKIEDLGTCHEFSDNPFHFISIDDTGRIPKKEDFIELCANCDIEHVYVNRVPMNRFTSKANGESIVFPDDDNMLLYWSCDKQSSGSIKDTAYNMRLSYGVAHPYNYSPTFMKAHIRLVKYNKDRYK